MFAPCTYDSQAKPAERFESVVLEFESVDGGGHLHSGMDIGHRFESNNLLVLLFLLLLVLKLSRMCDTFSQCCQAGSSSAQNL